MAASPELFLEYEGKSSMESSWTRLTRTTYVAVMSGAELRHCDRHRRSRSVIGFDNSQIELASGKGGMCNRVFQ